MHNHRSKGDSMSSSSSRAYQDFGSACGVTQFDEREHAIERRLVEHLPNHCVRGGLLSAVVRSAVLVTESP